MGSGLKKWDNRVIIILLLLLVAVIGGQAAYSRFVTPRAVMHLAGSRFEIRIADDNRTRIQGLSGTANLPADEAMLFIFDSNGKWPIWMKDMNYPIDIVWLDESKRVVDFVTNVPPSSYPNKIFSSDKDARYVVEFQSGIVNKRGIRVGQEAVFSGTSRDL